MSALPKGVEDVLAEVLFTRQLSSYLFDRGRPFLENLVVTKVCYGEGNTHENCSRHRSL